MSFQNAKKFYYLVSSVSYRDDLPENMQRKRASQESNAKSPFSFDVRHTKTPLLKLKNPNYSDHSTWLERLHK